MAEEIERKFLVTDLSWREDAVGVAYRQGYLSKGANCTTRVRIAGERGLLTLKGKTKGIARSEYEYDIPLEEAEEILAELVNGPTVEKVRYKVDYAGHLWEVDIFEGANEGLVMAEIELAIVRMSTAAKKGGAAAQHGRSTCQQRTRHPPALWSRFAGSSVQRVVT